MNTSTATAETTEEETVMVVTMGKNINSITILDVIGVPAEVTLKLLIYSFITVIRHRQEKNIVAVCFCSHPSDK